MPDLNFENKEVREEMKKVAKFYLDMGIDGFRLDAAMHIYKETNKNLQWWKEFSDYVKGENKDAVLVGEVWDKTQTISQYMGTLDSNFNFPVGEAILSMTSTGSVGNADFTIINSYEQYAAKNQNFIDSPFLTNHDQNRVMSTLSDLEKAKKAAAILLTLPGTPFIYYGEEIGMTGMKPDERIREPFIWDDKDSTKNTSWIDSTNETEKIAVNVQMKDKNSLLNHYKNIIAVRNNNDALKYGNFELIDTAVSNVFAFKRSLKDKSIYVYINLGSKDLKEKVDISKAKVLYSNKKKDKSLSFKGELELKGDEILILEK
jgi:glycosidase